jgi:hypothetical protein
MHGLYSQIGESPLRDGVGAVVESWVSFWNCVMSDSRTGSIGNRLHGALCSIEIIYDFYNKYKSVTT